MCNQTLPKGCLLWVTRVGCCNGTAEKCRRAVAKAARRMVVEFSRRPAQQSEQALHRRKDQLPGGSEDKQRLRFVAAGVSMRTRKQPVAADAGRRPQRPWASPWALCPVASKYRRAA